MARWRAALHGATLGDVGASLFLAWAFVYPPVLVAATQRLDLFAAVIFAGVVSVVGWLLLVSWARSLRPWAGAAVGWIVLLLLPAWGLYFNHEAEAHCNPCNAPLGQFRPLAEPEVWGLLAVHTLAALSYVASRRRPVASSTALDALLTGGLAMGVLLHIFLALQFGGWVFTGLLIPLVFCASTPVWTIPLFGAELLSRLRRGGAGGLLRTAGVTLLAAPSYWALTALWRGHWLAAGDVFTRTCGHTFSQLPVNTEAVCGGHYLCTVAAQGHPWLVKPQRWGRRHGRPVLVNRQLAVANAFEDLLHQRWPRLAGWARRAYDRFGPNVCVYLRSPYAADLVYLAMKPAEWLFYATLLLLDKGSPEARIDRMYR